MEDIGELFRRIVYLFLYKYKEDEDRCTKLSELLISTNKPFFIFSIIYAKSVYEMHSFMFSIQRNIINNNVEETLSLINEKLMFMKNEKQE